MTTISFTATASNGVLSLSADWLNGKVMPVYSNYPRTTLVQGFEFFAGVQTTGTRIWQQCYRYPRAGCSFVFADLGNDHQLGQLFAIVPTIFLPLNKDPDRPFHTDVKIGLGLAYLNRRYDSLDNPRNFSYSSPFTWQFNVGLQFRYRVSPQAQVSLGVQWMHSSDAHTFLPNVGVNSFVATLGVIVHPTVNRVLYTRKEKLLLDRKVHYGIRLGYGFQERGDAFKDYGNGHKYPVYNLSLYISKRIGRVLNLNTGFTYRYYQNYYELIQANHSYAAQPGLHASALLWWMGTEFQFGRIALNMEVGANLYKPYFKDYYDTYEKGSRTQYLLKQIIATRFGFNLYLFDPYTRPRHNAFIGSYVNANLGQAEFMEFNVGYVF